jgi:hypothetical protein
LTFAAVHESASGPSRHFAATQQSVAFDAVDGSFSLSWLAKARMSGDGPPFIRVGRSIRYSEAALHQWMKSRQRLSTSEQ